MLQNLSLLHPPRSAQQQQGYCPRVSQSVSCTVRDRAWLLAACKHCWPKYILHDVLQLVEILDQTIHANQRLSLYQDCSVEIIFDDYNL